MHFKTCDVVLKACTNAIDGLMAEMELQHNDIAEEAKHMREEEEEKHRATTEGRGGANHQEEVDGVGSFPASCAGEGGRCGRQRG